MYPYVNFADVSIPSYSLMIVLAGIAALIIALARRSINGLSLRNLILCVIIAALGFYAGAKLYTLLLNIPFFINSYNLSFWEFYTRSGFALLGGFWGALFFILLFSRFSKISFWAAVDSLIPSLLVFQIISRSGCFLAGCCHGIPWEHGLVMEGTNGFENIPLFPVQLLEIFCVTLLFIYCMFYEKSKKSPGYILGFYMLGYGLIRLFTDFLRYRTANEMLGPLGIVQYICIIMVALGIYFHYFYKNDLSENIENTHI